MHAKHSGMYLSNDLTFVTKPKKKKEKKSSLALHNERDIQKSGTSHWFFYQTFCCICIFLEGCVSIDAGIYEAYYLKRKTGRTEQNSNLVFYFYFF